MQLLRGMALAVAFALPPTLAWAQGAVMQQGAATPGQTLMYTDRTHAIAVGGTALGQPPAPPNRANTLPSLYATVNPKYGNCQFSAYSNGPYARVCSGFDGSGNGMLSYDAIGGQPTGTLNFSMNGSALGKLAPNGFNLLGTPTSTLPPGGDSSNRIATTEFVTGQIAGASVAALPIANTNADLKTMQRGNGLRAMRIGVLQGGDGPSIVFVSQVGTCSANSMVDDVGSCVDANDGNSFKSVSSGMGWDVRQFGASPFASAATNTAAINAATKRAALSNAAVIISGSNYDIDGSIYYYNKSHIIWTADASLTKTSGGYCALQPADVPGHTYPQASIFGVNLENVSIDNNGMTGCALMVDSARHPMIEIRQLKGAATSGTFTYTDNDSTETYPNALLMIKGTPSIDNTASGEFFLGKIGNIADDYTCPAGSESNTGIWIGANPGSSDAHNPPNGNKFYGGEIYCNQIPLNIVYGSDNSFIGTDISINTGYAVLIGDGVNKRGVRRNHFLYPYLEANAGGGFKIASNATFNDVTAPASTSGTPSTLLWDDTYGGSNNIWRDNKTKYLDSQDWTTRAPVGTVLLPGISGQGSLYEGNDNQGADIERRGWGNSSAILTSRADGTHAAPTAVLANEQLGEFGSRAYDGTGYVTSRQAGFRILATEDQGVTSHGAGMRWFTTPNGTTTAIDGVFLYQDGGMALGSAGSFGFGTLNAQNGVYDNSVRLFTPCGAYTNINGTFSVSGVTHGQLFRVNTNVGAFSAIMPLTPADGDEYCFADQKGMASTNPFTIVGNGRNVLGAPTLVLNTNFFHVRLSYSAASDTWFQIN